MVRLYKNNMHDVILAAQLCKRSVAKYLLGVNDAKLREFERTGVVELAAKMGSQKFYHPKQISSLMHIAIKEELDKKYGKDGIAKRYFELTGKKLKV